ncbi:sensor domain-containing diguanylate cyclase [Sphingomonas sp.]|uniref:sensor domain-containing diguanylate cyclase n=1 Tax=Sphingomonas sp. TaxID=28214 RepID=UPI001ECCBAA3|nr:sensor domain-containing diguanylate cyclase [Sphingomonas sp.]MBX3593162.1 diguanylate cyclase [Sphingomonas sp.]
MASITLPQRKIPIIATVAISYFVLALGAIWLTRLSNNVALLWLANAPLIVAFCTRPRREHLALALSCMAASWSATTAISPYAPIAAMFMVLNVAEAWLTFALLRRFGHGRRPLTSFASIAPFVAAAGLLAPGIVGAFTATGLWLFQGAAPGFTYLNWLVGHGLGAVIGMPVALLLLGDRQYREGLNRERVGLFLLVTGAMVGVVVATFYQDRLSLLFLPILPIVVATTLFRFAGAAVAVFATAVIGALFTLAGHGPVHLVQGSDAFQLQFFQFYLGTVFLTALPFATMMAENRRLTETLAASEARHRLITEHASDAMMALDPDGTVRFASPSVLEVTGFVPSALVGEDALTLVAPEDRARVAAVHRAALANPDSSHRIDYRGVTPGGTGRWFETTTRAVSGPDGAIATVVNVVRDLSQYKAREADLERQASTDPMTGLLNRRAFQGRLAGLVRSDRGTSGVLALLDLDHFKAVNDRWGHPAGDAALLAFSDVLRDCVRAQDVISRLGGEEFAILFPDLHPAAASAACERVRSAVAAMSVVTPAGAFSITVSIGIALIAPDASPEAILRQADAALYRAKAAGRNRVTVAAAV